MGPHLPPHGHPLGPPRRPRACMLTRYTILFVSLAARKLPLSTWDVRRAVDKLSSSFLARLISSIHKQLSIENSCIV